MEYTIEYYRRENGDTPVFDFLLTLNPKQRAKAYREIELLQKHGPNLREPYVKTIKGYKNKGIFELRVKFSTDISRIFYFLYLNNVYVLLNGFVKKTNNIPENEIEKARKYRIDYEMRNKNEQGRS